MLVNVYTLPLSALFSILTSAGNVSGVNLVVVFGPSAKLTEISYVRNGDVDDANVTYEYYILGEKLNEWNTANY